ncbi:hypothetical protein ES705_47857 [subsurface metagenome]
MFESVLRRVLRAVFGGGADISAANPLPVAKAGFFRAWCGDYRVIDYITNKGEFPNSRTPIHLRGDGTEQFKIELAEIGAGDIEHMFCVMKGWDE